MIRIPTGGPPVHPGEMLEKEFLEPLGMSQSELARRIGVPFQRVNGVVRERRAVTPDTARRLSRLFGNSIEFWMTLQWTWDLWHALQDQDEAEIENIEPLAGVG